MRARPINGGLKWWHARPFYGLLFKGFLVTIAALAAAIWVFLSMPDISGIHSDHDAQFIRERCHIFLVPPEWIRGSVSGLGDAGSGWWMAEVEARWAVVFMLWAGSVSFFIWRHSRRRGQALPANPPGIVVSAG